MNTEQNQKISFQSAAFLILACAVLLVCVSFFVYSVSRTSVENQRSVSVSGQGAVQVLPDVATIQLSVVTRNSSVEEAAGENAAVMTDVQDALIALGLARESFSTSNYRIFQETSYVNGKSIAGDYRVSNMLTIVLREITKAGTVIDAAIAAGANELSSLSFSVSDTSEAVAEARLLAMQQAREAAEKLAEASGAKLGRVLSVSEENYNRPLYQSNATLYAADTAAATPVSAGKSDISVSVHAVFELN